MFNANASPAAVDEPFARLTEQAFRDAFAGQPCAAATPRTPSAATSRPALVRPGHRRAMRPWPPTSWSSAQTAAGKARYPPSMRPVTWLSFHAAATSKTPVPHGTFSTFLWRLLDDQALRANRVT
jgi:hypothetical protein